MSWTPENNNAEGFSPETLPIAGMTEESISNSDFLRAYNTNILYIKKGEPGNINGLAGAVDIFSDATGLGYPGKTLLTDSQQGYSGVSRIVDNTEVGQYIEIISVDDDISMYNGVWKVLAYQPSYSLVIDAPFIVAEVPALTFTEGPYYIGHSKYDFTDEEKDVILESWGATKRKFTSTNTWNLEYKLQFRKETT